MAASLAFLVARWGLSFEFLYSAAFAGLLIALAFIDLRHYLLPDVLTLPGGLLGLMGAFWSQRVDWKASLAGLGIGVGGLLAVILLYYLVRRREGMGMGDVKMLGMMGAFLGWQWMLLALMIAVMAGTVVGLLAILIRGKSFQYALPFGTFLSLGGLVTLYWGDGLASLLFPGL